MKIQIIDSELEKFIESQDEQTTAKILRTIDLLEKFGSRLRMPHSEKVSKEIYELRIRGAREVRIFYAFVDNQAVLLHGFIKKSQKIPSREINIATNKLRRLVRL